jgi:hypothetical protein
MEGEEGGVEFQAERCVCHSSCAALRTSIVTAAVTIIAATTVSQSLINKFD